MARIIAKKRPKAFLLENVKNLQSHDKGRTFDVIRRTLEDALGYQVFFKVIDGALAQRPRDAQVGLLQQVFSAAHHGLEADTSSWPSV